MLGSGAQLLQQLQNQAGPVLPQRQPGVLGGAGELWQGWEALQGPLKAEGLGAGPRLHLDQLLGIRAVLVQSEDEGAEVSVEQLDPQERLGPQVPIPLREQEVLFVLIITDSIDPL